MLALRSERESQNLQHKNCSNKCNPNIAIYYIIFPSFMPALKQSGERVGQGIQLYKYFQDLVLFWLKKAGPEGIIWVQGMTLESTAQQEYACGGGEGETGDPLRECRTHSGLFHERSRRGIGQSSSKSSTSWLRLWVYWGSGVCWGDCGVHSYSPEKVFRRERLQVCSKIVCLATGDPRVGLGDRGGAPTRSVTVLHSVSF